MSSLWRVKKIAKVPFRKTARGKANLLIDAGLHGRGKGRAIADEVAHSIVEGGFKTSKFFRYGNAARILGKFPAAILRMGFKSLRMLIKMIKTISK